ncbi:MAG: FGGY-family carbohydrate kinase [Clostridiales bacterium]|nr:FGGY-family carbohydrate kinase [Clostridiales bacterium]
MEAKNLIEEGKSVLGIEFGSTRIKAVLVDEKGNPIASGSHEWENELLDGIWTYSEKAIWDGLADCYADLKKNVKEQYGVTIKSLGAIGFSAMMHGYLPFDENDNLLVPFRTWRNTITEEAADKLTEALNFNIPQRWSISHLYQAILNGEAHVPSIRHFTTLAGFVHFKLSGCKVLGVGDASGMFPIDSKTGTYDEAMLNTFDAMIKEKNFPWNIREILPKVLSAGENAGNLTDEGAKLLDVDGDLSSGILMCPPEGDAGTGMVATNSVLVETGNISAGTSVFAMIVLKENMKNLHKEIDMVTTPTGDPVAMVHCNNCTSEINAWVKLFDEFGKLMGKEFDRGELFEKLYGVALSGDKDCGGLISYNYFSGEPVTGFSKGSPLFVRSAEDSFTLPNFMRMHLYSALAALKVGLDILTVEEKVTVKKMYGHGGFFKTPKAGQTVASAAIGSPVCVMETAGEGGAWGIALLALYMVEKKEQQTLASYLEDVIFAGSTGSELLADQADMDGFNAFMKKYVDALKVEKAAVDLLG